MINENELKTWDLERVNSEIKQRYFLLEQNGGNALPIYFEF